MNLKIILSSKKIIDGVCTCICENSKYLKSVSDTLVAECDEIVIVMETVSAKKTNTKQKMSQVLLH